MTPRKLALAGFLVCCVLIASALYLQYVDHLEPCPLCMLQRIAFTVLGFVFLIAGLQGPRKTGMRVYAMLSFIIAATGLGLATRHVMLQWNPPAYEGCTADLFYQLRQFPMLSVVEKALRATGDCARIDWTLTGLSIAQWSWIWFLVLLLLCVWIFVRAGVRQSSMWR